MWLVQCMFCQRWELKVLQGDSARCSQENLTVLLGLGVKVRVISQILVE